MITDEMSHHGVTTEAGPTKLAVEGMTCQNCVRHVTEAIQGVPGVSRVSVSLDQARAEVHWTDQAEPNLAAVVSAVEKAGFEASAIDASNGTQAMSPWSPFAGWRFNIVLGIAVTLPLAAGEWLGHWSMQPWFRWLAFSLALPVQILCGARFYRGAWMQLKAGESNMDTLVSLGSTTAFLYSVWALFSGRTDHLYFMESAAIITLISIGHGLEAYTSAKASNSLRSLMTLTPPMASRRLPDGSVSQVPAGELAVEDVVVLLPGDRVPADGQVIDGKSAIDESMLTGESIPIEKKAGTPVYAGTINQDSQLIVRVTATGEATALAHIITVIQRAQNSRASIQRLGDKVSGVFVPIVVGIAVLTGLWWGLFPDAAWKTHQFLAPWLWNTPRIDGALAAALIHASGVLIVACPCAMGLATPIAIMSGANAAARRGILIRDGIALEKCGRIDTILFDKTGTLTEGKVTVASSKIFPVTDVSEAQIKNLAAALATPSRHPLSVALAGQDKTISGLNGERNSMTDWRELRGSGIEAKISVGGRVQFARLGSLNWLRENKVDTTPSADLVKEWSEQGATVVGLALGQQLGAIFSLRDSVKPSAAGVVQTLRQQGLQLYMVTGDGRQTALAIARQIGLPEDNVFAETRPEKKADIIQHLQQQGRQVAFIGDGINDAPALEQASLGIAVSQASDIAREAADIVLLKSDIRVVPETLALAQATLRVIHSNLFWAFFYNAASVPLAALGFLSPVLCAAAMGLSDLVVIGNALRLQRRP